MQAIRLLTAAVFGLATIALVSQASAEDPKPVPQFRIVQEAGDAAQGEVHRLKEFRGSDLVRITTKYTDNRVKVEEFNADGSRHGLIETVNNILKTTLYTDDGKGIKRVTEIGSKGHSSTEYRPDGKTIWTVTKNEGNKRESQYYGKDGKLRLKRSYAPAGYMLVTVYDDKGNELYTQHWTPGFAGYIIHTVTEKTATGERKIWYQGKNVERIEYFKKDGTLDRTESGNQIVTQPDGSLSQELDPADDTTAPKTRKMPPKK